MPRKFKTVGYEATLDQAVSIRECLPPEHLARFIAQVITELDLSEIYAAYSRRGGTAIAPEVLLGLLFYGYVSGVFSTDDGQALHRLRKCTVEPVIGIIKETIGFRQFSLRGLTNVQGEWSLVCLAFNLKRLHRLIGADWVSPTGG